MGKNYVCNGAAIKCQMCTKPEGTLTVTSNQIKIQGKLFATENDKAKPNLMFEGNCKASPYQASPCIGVIVPTMWQDTSDTTIQGGKALLDSSTIMCGFGGVAIEITDHLQVSKPTELQPIIAPVLSPDFEPKIINFDWKSNKLEKTLDYPNKVITKTIFDEKIWLDIQTSGMLPGEEIIFEIFDENDTENILLKTSGTIDPQGITRIKLQNIKPENEKAFKLIAKASYDETTKAEAKIEILPLPKVIVDFRPSKNYDGEYGFDYMRDKNKKDKLTYKDILGTNKTIINKTTKKKENKFTKYTTDTKYNSLKDDHYTTITFPWYKDAKGKKIEYIQSWLTIYPKATQTLSLQIDTLEKNNQDLTLEYDKSLFKLNTDLVPAQSKGEKRLKDHLTIECIKEFDKVQTIKVMLGSTQFGQLNILPNAKAKRKKVDVLFIKVETKLKKKKKTASTTGEDAFLKKYLTQAYIQPNIIEEVLDLTADTTFNKTYDTNNNGYIDNRTGIHDYLNKKVDVKYKDYLKVYFIPDECPSFNKDGIKVGRVNGQAKDISSDAVVLFDGHNTSTTTHESLHALGLYHTFSSHKDTPYSYKKGETYNIMDYSHQSKYGSKKRIMTWLWQWKKLWDNKLIKSE
ncbi:PAAR-like protein [Tenacibaculum finnmarkense]|uniref:PAAR-like protein n=1 Tax=Tenacibaculum finnmarkense TaxID=2781243 RepID=UPI001E533C8D|nr:PAAR-like protein [Tenacibaculum finnmarkense]MCD8411094.1 DUF4280 domain-containing protein [Tenacibaculum finnmarkense genomovar ulcerans]